MNGDSNTISTQYLIFDIGGRKNNLVLPHF